MCGQADTGIAASWRAALSLPSDSYLGPAVCSVMTVNTTDWRTDSKQSAWPPLANSLTLCLDTEVCPLFIPPPQSPLYGHIC